MIHRSALARGVCPAARPARGWRFGLAWLGLLWAVAVGGAGEAVRDFDLPAGPAERTLKLFSAQAGVGLLAASNVVRDVRTPALHGRYPPAEAIARLLHATGLEASQDAASQAFVVRRGPARPLAPAFAADGSVAGRVRDAGTGELLANATITVPALERQAVSGSGGHFVLSGLPAGEHLVTVAHLGYPEWRQVVRVAPGGEASVDVVLGETAVKLRNFVVTGEREGQARALQQKRQADNLVDIVSADSAGKLPDENAAEAVRRLPGVFAEIDQNEGRYIVVRGIDASLNAITINGVAVGSTEAGTRGTGMDSVPADLISRIEVVKAVTPDMDHQAIGATVNIVTASAFDRTEPFAHGRLAGGFYHGPTAEFRQHDLTPYSGSATAGTTFGDGKWGVVVGGSYSFRHYLSNRRSGGNPWYPAAPEGEGAAVYFPGQESLYHYDVQRWRQGLNAALEFRPNENHQFALRVTDNRFKDEEGRQLNSFEFFRTAFPASYTPTTATFTGGRSTVEYRYYLQKHNITNYAFEGKHTLGDGATKLDYTVALGNADKRTPSRVDWEFRSPTNISSAIDTGREYWVVTPSANFYDASNYPFRRVRFRRDEETEDNLTAALNFRKEAALLGRGGYWQVGGRYFSREKNWDRTNRDYTAGAEGFSLAEPGLTQPAPLLMDGLFRMSPQIDVDALEAFFAANPRYFAENPAGSLANSTASDFAFEERILAAYAMAKFNVGRLGVLAGWRVERSQADIAQTDLTVAGAASPALNRFSRRHTNLLPGVHLRWAAQGDWIVRAAWTNTLGRPNYPDLAGASTLSYAETAPGSGVHTGTVSAGNPDLRPYESMNFDLSAETYFDTIGIFSVSAFAKRVKHPVFVTETVRRNVTYAGLYFESLALTRPDNAAAGELRGIEVNFQRQLTMLPAPFDGLGLGLNFSVIDSRVTLPNRPGESLPFPKQAGRIGNLALYYEKGRFQSRIAGTFTGSYLMTYGDDRNGDQYKAKRRIVDAKVSYRLTRHVTLFADVINLGEEPLDEYSGEPARNAATERYWWTANFGINWQW